MLCPKCSKAVSLEYGQNKCPYCGETLGVEEGLKPPSPSSAGANCLSPETCREGMGKPLWDNEGPFFSWLFNTWKQSTFYPGTFFRAIPTATGIGRPLLYAIIVGFINTAVNVFWNFIYTALQIPVLGMRKEAFAEMPPFIYALMPFIMIGIVILSPILVTIGMFIWSGILHLCLIIVGGNKKGFEATFRSVSYGQSPLIFGIVPVCGGFVGAIWAIVTTIIGLKETHQIPVWKAILAYFLPLIFCCCIMAVIVVAIGIPTFIAGAAAAKGAGSYMGD